MSSLYKTDKKYVSSGQKLKLSDSDKITGIKKTGETPVFFRTTEAILAKLVNFAIY